MGFFERYGDWLIIALLGVVAIAFARWVFSGGLRQSRKKARSIAANDPQGLSSVVKNLTAELGSTGDGIQLIRHDEGGSADLTDEELQHGVDGVLKKRSPLS